MPPARTKNRREHVIPLSNQALAILEAQPRRVEADNTERDHVFGYGRDRGYQDWSGSKTDLDARIASARSGSGLDWRLHDFRRSLSTALHERFNVPPHVVEAILGHVGGHKAGVAGVYNKALYLDERRRALERWAAYIDAAVSSKPKKTKVVKFPEEREINSGPAGHLQAEPALTRATVTLPEADEKDEKLEGRQHALNQRPRRRVPPAFFLNGIKRLAMILGRTAGRTLAQVSQISPQCRIGRKCELRITASVKNI